MYLDVESMVTLNTLRRAEIYREVAGAYRVRQPWVERPETRPVCPLRRPIRALRAAAALWWRRGSAKARMSNAATTGGSLE